jgi:hypothetical protein
MFTQSQSTTTLAAGLSGPSRYSYEHKDVEALTRTRPIDRSYTYTALPVSSEPSTPPISAPGSSTHSLTDRVRPRRGPLDAPMFGYAGSSSGSRTVHADGMARPTRSGNAWASSIKRRPIEGCVAQEVVCAVGGRAALVHVGGAARRV